ncbi:MAG: hypothetical protein RIB59_10620 [Rhodospirillales bacterium]
MEREIDELLERLNRLEEEVERKFDERRAEFKYEIRMKRAVFEKSVLARHRQIKIGLIRFIRTSPWMVLVTAPVIYLLIVPIVILDISISFYQWVCFPIWGINRSQRSRFIILDRHRLAYLNAIEKLNCLYCGYANGVIAYVRDVVARTEQYWCPIKHAMRVKSPHGRYRNFLEYGDGEGYRRRLEDLRAALKKDREV